MSKVYKSVVWHATPIVIEPLQRVEEELISADISGDSAEESEVTAAQAALVQEQRLQEENQKLQQELTERLQEVENLKAAALSESEEVISNAHNEAATILEEATQIRNGAYAEGLKNGREEGFLLGIEEGRQKLQDEMQNKMMEYTRLIEETISNAKSEAIEIVVDAERQIIDIALSVARKILAREIEENPMVILPIVKAALDKVSNYDQVNVRVNPEDFNLVFQARHDLQNMASGDRVITVTSDPGIMPGGCVIETPHGSVDARLDSQFDMLRNALRDVTP